MVTCLWFALYPHSLTAWLHQGDRSHHIRSSSAATAPFAVLDIFVAKRRIGYDRMAQEDNFIPAMTVKETLTFYAAITLKTPDYAARNTHVQRVLAAMGLSAAEHTLVGGSIACTCWNEHA
jgi:hypothetical protein